MMHTYIWPYQRAEACTSAKQAVHTLAEWVAREIMPVSTVNGDVKYNNMIFECVLAAGSESSEAYPSYAHHIIGLAAPIIHTITEQAQVTMTVSQHPVQL